MYFVGLLCYIWSMKLRFISPNTLDKNLKATVHRTGKLGFSFEAAKKLKLSENKSASIAIDEDKPDDKDLYLIIQNDKPDGSFPIYKAGKYHYINTKTLFDSLKLDYLKNSVVYDIMEEIIDGVLMYKFKKREKSKKLSDNP